MSALEKASPTTLPLWDVCSCHRSDKFVRTLALNGGGAKGGAQLEVLKDLERRTDLVTGELFDHITGTSVGGIIGAFVLLPDGNGGYLYSAAKAQEKFMEVIQTVFHRSWLHTVGSMGGVRGPKYKRDGLEQAISENFGDFTMSQLRQGYCAIAADLDEKAPVYFTRREAQKDPDWNLPLSTVLAAVPSAETYWPAARIEFKGKTHMVGDGGISYLNTPCMSSITQARKTYNCGLNIVQCYISTGYDSSAIPEATADGGVYQWAFSALDVAGTVNTKGVINDAAMLLGDNFHGFNPPVAGVALDETDPKKLDEMLSVTREWLETDEVADRMAKLAKKLELGAKMRADAESSGSCSIC